MPWYRNKGAPFRRREDGELIPRDAIAEIGDADYRQRRHKLVAVEFVPRAGQMPPNAIPFNKPVDMTQRVTPPPADDVHVAEEKAAEWPMPMDPRRYLDLHPSGEHADLARELVGDDDDGASDE